jgi:hypothetical protein
LSEAARGASSSFHGIEEKEISTAIQKKKPKISSTWAPPPDE